MTKPNIKYAVHMSDLDIPIQYKLDTDVYLKTNNFEIGYTTTNPGTVNRCVYVIADGYRYTFTLTTEMYAFRSSKRDVHLFIGGKLFNICTSERSSVLLRDSLLTFINYLESLDTYRKYRDLHPSVRNLIVCKFN